MMNCCGAAREGPLRWCAEAGMQEMPSRLRAKNSQLSSHNHFIIETFFFFPFGGEFLPANALWMNGFNVSPWSQCHFSPR